METISLYDALNRMRELTTMNVPFSIEYISFNSTNKYSDGLKQVSKVLLRTGLSREKSQKAEVLIGYTIEPTEEPRWFYLPLLMKFNGITITP